MLIEGETEISAPDGSTQTVTTSHVAQATVNETGTTELTVRDMYPGDVPEFARDMIAENADVQTKITDNGGNLSDATAPDHVWLDATCTAPRTCADCGLTEGEPIAHTMKEANYQEPATCEVCGYTEGDPLPSKSETMGITANVTAGAEYTYHTVTEEWNDTTGTFSLTGYQTIASDEEHEALDGYEWKTAIMHFKFDDDNTTEGIRWSYFWVDDYSLDTTMTQNVDGDWSTTTVSWYGEEYTQCKYMFTKTLAEWEGTTFYLDYQIWALLPVGYDGALIGAYNTKSDLEFGENPGIDEFYDADTLIFRMDYACFSPVIAAPAGFRGGGACYTHAGMRGCEKATKGKPRFSSENRGIFFRDVSVSSSLGCTSALCALRPGQRQL